MLKINVLQFADLLLLMIFRLLKKPFLLLPAVIFLHSAVNAKKYTTSYISLEIPESWTCITEGANHLCFNKISRKLAREAVIILTAKEKGPQDSVMSYINYLKDKRVYTSKKKKSITSKVFHSKQRSIRGHPFADGFHLESEIPLYYTRYIGTTKKSLAVLVTYTAHKTLWKKYTADFNKSINSIRLMDTAAALRKIRNAKKQQIGSGRKIRDYLEGIIGDGDIGEGGGAEDSGGLGDWIQDNLGKAVGGGAAGLILLILLSRMMKRKPSLSGGGTPSSRSSSRRRRRRR